ncbi:MAG: lysostaphin resistance A-like protein [Blastocatellia bacterium]
MALRLMGYNRRMRCPNCGLVNSVIVTECRRCGASVQAVTAERFSASTNPQPSVDGQSLEFQSPSRPAGAYNERLSPYPYAKGLPRTSPNAMSALWSTPAAFGVWFFSVVVILALPTLVVLGYMVLGSVLGAEIPTEPLAAQRFGESPPSALLSVASILLAHLLTFVLFWPVVTLRGRRDFFKAISWHWIGPRPVEQFWVTAGIVAAIVALELVFGAVLPRTSETDFEKLVNTSVEVRVFLAAIAIFSAPLIEEVVYRGVLYSALEQSAGKWLSVIIVSVLFFSVHLLQYYGAWAGLAAIMVLSLSLTILRAKTGSLFPCFVVHTLYNTVGAVIILLQGTHPAK